MNLLQTLNARYDTAVLAPPEPVADAAAVRPHDEQAWQALQAWCAGGSGPGGRPLLQPRALPAVDERFGTAWLHGPDASRTAELARWLCLERDGSLQLLACHGAAGRVALRLGTKLNDVMWWRRRAPADPWDSGTLRSDAVSQPALAAFTPRRATLIVASGLSETSLQMARATLTDRSASYAHPVRLLVLGTPPPDDTGTVIRCR